MAAIPIEIMSLLGKTPTREDVSLLWTNQDDFYGTPENRHAGFSYEIFPNFVRNELMDEASLYYSPRKSFGVLTKAIKSSRAYEIDPPASGDIKVCVRNGDVAAVNIEALGMGVIRDYEQADWEAGLVRLGIDTTTKPGIMQVANTGGKVSRVFTGENNNGVILSDGGVRIWGSNTYGQRAGGNENTNISGLTGIITELAIYQHVLALVDDGTVRAWGRNDESQCADGTKDASISGLSNVTQVAVGLYHSVALKSDGTVWGWGRNGYGQLGEGGNITISTPRQIGTISDAIKIAATQYCTVVLRRNGKVRVIGYDQGGQGYNSSMDADMGRAEDIVGIAAGYDYIIMLRGDGRIQMSGHGGEGGIEGRMGRGIGRRRCVDEATQVEISNIADIACCNKATIALTTNGMVRAWGKNDYGLLGGCSKTFSHADLTGVVQIDAYATHVLARLTDGRCKAWGDNANGRLGGGSTAIEIPGLIDVVDIAAGGDHSLFCRSDGSIWACGSNTYGQCGQPIGGNIMTATQIAGTMEFIKVAAGAGFSVGLKGNGSVWVWGLDSYGQSGGGGNTATPTQVVGVVNATDITAADHTGFALIDGGTVQSWGQDVYGLRAGGAPGVAIPGLTGIVQIKANYRSVVAMRQDRVIKSWGSNTYGQCGQEGIEGSIGNNVIGIVNPIKIGQGRHHAMFVDADSKVIGYGSNEDDKIGCMVTEAFEGIDDVVEVTGGAHTVFCRRSNGGLRSWGDDDGIGNVWAILSDRVDLVMQRNGMSHIKGGLMGNNGTLFRGIDGNAYYTGWPGDNLNLGISSINIALPAFTPGLWPTTDFQSAVIDLGVGVAHQLDGIFLGAYNPAGVTMQVAVRSGDSLAAGGAVDANWSEFVTVPGNDVKTHNVKLVQPPMGGARRYHQYRIKCNINGAIGWKVEDAVALFKPANWSRLLDVNDNDTAIQAMEAKPYWSVVILGVTDGTADWHVDDVSITGRHWYVDLIPTGIYEVGATNLKNLQVTGIPEIYGMGRSVEESATPTMDSFSDLSLVATVDFDAKTAIASDFFRARHLRFSVISDGVITVKVYAKNDLNRTKPQLRILNESFVELPRVGANEELEYSDTFPTERRGDGLPTPGATSGLTRHIKAIEGDIRELKFKISGEAAGYIKVSLTNNYATAVLANDTFFVVGDILAGASRAVYFWMDAGASVLLGSKGYKLKDFMFLSREL